MAFYFFLVQNVDSHLVRTPINVQVHLVLFEVINLSPLHEIEVNLEVNVYVL